VAKLAVTLRKLILPNDDSHDDILTAAGLCHDIAKGMPEHGRYGAVLAREALAGLCTAAELDEICAIIRLHYFNKGHNDYSDWVKLHQDADCIDHSGTYFLWNVFSYRAWRHEGDLAEIARQQLDEFPLGLVDSVNFEVSKKIAAEKLAFHRAFWERMRVEANGEIWEGSGTNEFVRYHATNQ
jgi:HD superfamily phosphodiesterase